MAKIKANVHKDFLFEFQRAYIEARQHLEDDRLEGLLTVRKSLKESDVCHMLDEDELISIIREDGNPLLKLMIKDGVAVSYSKNLFDQFEAGDGKAYFNEVKHQFSFQVFYLPNGFASEKGKRYTDYYGHHFLTTNQIQEIECTLDFDMGRAEQRDVVQEVYNCFKPFNSLIIIDPYLLDDSNLFPDFLDSIFKDKQLKRDIFVDIIYVQQKYESAWYERRILKLEEFLNTIKTKYNLANIVLKAHEVRSAEMHDRCFIGNGFIINSGHGLAALKPNYAKQSTILFSSIFYRHDNITTFDKIVNILLKMKKAIRHLESDNPIWKILD